nr:nicalin-1-like isoform X1 [Tanacetum cinerariifolium]
MLKLTKSLERKLGNNINNFADKGSLAVNPSYITSWLDLMLTTPRVAPFLSKDGAFTMASKKELLDHNGVVQLSKGIRTRMKLLPRNPRRCHNSYRHRLGQGTSS